jgi:plastocyanin
MPLPSLLSLSLARWLPAGPLLCILVLWALLPAPTLAAPWTVQARDAAGRPLADVVVAVELRGRPSKASGINAEMGQRERQFTPLLLVVQTGTAVHFPNFDTVRHHVYSFSPIKVFETKLYVGTPAQPTVFDKSGVATLGCNIHDRMSAHIVVVDSPLFARTDASGQARLELPAGEHQLRFWHASMKTPLLRSQGLSMGSAATQTQLNIVE